MLAYIEKKRGNNNIFWRIAVFMKDSIWLLKHKIASFLNKKFKMFISFVKVQRKLKKYKNVKKYHKVSFCVTSMDRLCHLKKTLIKNIENNISYPNVEFVLLDYNSNDGLQEWVEDELKEYLKKGILKYYRIEWPTKFHMSNAKNIAHYLATGDVLCSLDADNFTNKNFAFYINFKFSNNNNIVGYGPGKQGDFGGRIFISKDNFKQLNGYDENFIGWGYEDSDFKHRALEMGVTGVKIAPFFLSYIAHSDNMRDKNMSISITESKKINKKLFLEKRKKAKNII